MPGLVYDILEYLISEVFLDSQIWFWDLHGFLRCVRAAHQIWLTLSAHEYLVTNNIGLIPWGKFLVRVLETIVTCEVMPMFGEAKMMWNSERLDACWNSYFVVGLGEADVHTVLPGMKLSLSELLLVCRNCGINWLLIMWHHHYYHVNSYCNPDSNWPSADVRMIQINPDQSRPIWINCSMDKPLGSISRFLDFCWICGFLNEWQ